MNQNQLDNDLGHYNAISGGDGNTLVYLDRIRFVL